MEMISSHKVIDLQQSSTPHDDTRYDYVMVFSNSQSGEADEIKRKLVGAKLVVKQEASRDGDEIFLYITTTPDLFVQKAEYMQLKKRIKPEFQGGYAKFKQRKKDKFQTSTNDALFTSYERATIINYMIEVDAGMDVNMALSKQRLLKCFPLHEQEVVEKFIKEHVDIKTWWKPFDNKVIEEIKDYFGSYVAIYFAWLLYYTKFLIPSAVIGVILFGYSLGPDGFDNVLSPFYAIFIAIWASVFIEFWKRKNAEITTRWDMMEFEDEERIRPSFVGEEKYGVYMKGVFVQLQPEPGKPEPPRTLYAPPAFKVLKMSAGFSILVTFATAVIITTLGIFVFRVFVQRIINRTFGGIVAGMVNAAVIMGFSMIYRRVAKYLCDWENHRTDAEYENQLILKNFLFQFINSYISLFYIAFMKGRFRLFGMDTEQCNPDCMTELTIQLGTIFLTNMTMQQMNEVGLPWLKQKLSISMESRKLSRHSRHIDPISQAEAESKRWPYSTTFDDYNEMAIQFGYLTLFAVAFPAAPAAALLNNMVEARTDLLKLVKALQRPEPREANTIGTWLEILETISYLAILTNCALIAFTSTQLNKLNPDMTPFMKLWISLLAEHLIFFVKFLIQKMIPDTPSWVLEDYARREYIKQQQIEEVVLSVREAKRRARETAAVEERDGGNVDRSSLVNLDD